MEIVEHGFASTTVGGISRRAHVSIRTFYEHFSSREELFLDAYNAGAQSAESWVEDCIARRDAWPQRVLSLVNAVFDIFSRSGDFELGLLIGSSSAGPRALDLRTSVQEKWSAILRRELCLARTSDPELSRLTLDVDEALGIAVVAGAEQLFRRTLALSSKHTTEVIQPAFTYLVTSAAGLSLARLRGLDPNRPYRDGLQELIEVLTDYERTKDLPCPSKEGASLLSGGPGETMID